MTWSTGSDPAHVILVFEEFPNHYVDIDDAELARYLESRDSQRVAVQFAVTTRLGCVERLESRRIGERDDWARAWGGSGWVEREQPSPWDRFRCKIPWH